MFCPSCGAEHALDLRYCHRCGANLNTLTRSETVPVNLTKPILIIGAILTFLTLGGFGALIRGAHTLAEVVHGNDPLIAVILLGMIVILTVDIFLVLQLRKLINAALKSEPSTNRHSQTAFSAAPSQLPRPDTSHLLPAPSVTENTTRFFEPQYREPVVSEPRAVATGSHPDASKKS
jgi:hypothetical protein